MDEAGNALTSTNPTGGASTWTPASIDAGNQLSAVSCTTTFCVAVDDAGQTFTATVPTGGAADWHAADVDGTQSLLTVSCASESLCVAGDNAGNMIASTNPTGGTPVWTVTNITSWPIGTTSCPTSSFCMASGGGVRYASTDPGGGAWTAVGPSTISFTLVSCASTSLCLAGDALGYIYTSTDPTVASQWDGPDTAGAGSFTISCPSNQMCVVVYRNGYVLLGLNPPSVSLGPVEVGSTTATLTGTVNPNGFNITDCHFAYVEGTSGLGVHTNVPCNPLPGSGTSAVTVTATLTGLSPQTSYSYVLDVSNPTGIFVAGFPYFTTTAVPSPPPPPTYTLTVSRTGGGSGTVASSPVGISCGAACTHGYTQGTTVTLTATPDRASDFSGWSGACSGWSTCTVSMSQARSVNASFNLIPELLTVGKKGHGRGKVTSSPSGISCGKTCSHFYPYGRLVTLTAKAARGSSFAGWSGPCSGRRTCTVTLTAARSVRASFHKLCLVPKVKGKRLRVAKHRIKAHGCRVGKIGHAFSAKVKKRHVIAQKPRPHRRRKPGAKIKLIVSKGEKQ